MVEGDADGINGTYANKYVFVFKFSEGEIISLREYTSDLLVATRLYKQKIVADD
jgi:ketosteroid isomerase-like protein